MRIVAALDGNALLERGEKARGMIGYWLVRALHDAMPGRAAGCLVSQTLVNPADPAFGNPTKFVGPAYDEARARTLAAQRGWVVRRDGSAWRRVLPRPEGGSLPYAVLGLVILAGLTMFDFQRLRRLTDLDSAPLIAASIFRALNVLLFFLRIFSRNKK